MPIRLAVVTAGLRSPSSTRMLADRLTEATVAALERRGGDGAAEVEVRVVEVRDHAHAVVDALLTGFPTGALKQALADVVGADALIVVTPTFQGGVSGMFKSFLDLVEEGQLRGTPVLLAATGGSERHSLVVDYAMRPLFSYLKATPTATGVFAATGDFGDGAAALERRIARAAGELADLVRGGSPAGTRADVAAGEAGPDAPAGADAGVRREESTLSVTPFGELLARAGIVEGN